MTLASTRNNETDSSRTGNWLSLKLSQKLPAVIVGASLVTAFAIGGWSYITSADSLMQSARDKLIAMNEARRAQLSDYLGSIEADMRVLSQNQTVKDALQAFDQAWAALGPDAEQRLQQLYIHDNPHPLGEKHRLDAADDGSAYSQAHRRFHPWLRTFLEERGYYDVFLFNQEGDLVYTVFKELDYATNLVRGEWKDSDLGAAFRAAQADPQRGTLNFFDFKPYGPSHGAAASFISTPLLDDSGTFQGVLVFQMPIGRINGVMQNSAGMGETGETYLVGEDLLMRSDSRFSDESTILSTQVDGKGRSGRRNRI